jgi:glycosyltransferase involved in cell wall biosynthesis
VKIIRIHNYYQQAGGEDSVLASEIKLLQSRGHDVATWFVHNDAIEGMGRLKLLGRTLWNGESYAALRRFFREQKAQVAHFDNTFPLISPAAYYAAKAEGVGVVQTLHNYRLLCVNAMLFRDGHVCEDCVGRFVPWPGVKHKCYRDDRKASGVVAAMLTTHRTLGTYQRQIDTYIALTEFSRRKYIDGGLPGEKIVVKPNFLEEDPGIGAGDGGFALFVGRLTEEKGINVALEAWKEIGEALPLKVVGVGPLEARVKEAGASIQGVEYLGRQPLDQVMRLMGEAACLIFPSTWYEGLPRTIVESLSKGTPVIASRLGAMEELVEPGRTGALFAPGDAGDLAAQVKRMLASGQLPAMRPAARREYEQKYTADQAHEALMRIYRSVSSR